MTAFVYKGYVATAELDPETGLFFGEVAGIDDVVTFQGRTDGEVRRAFEESVDLYLKTRGEQGLDSSPEDS